MKTVRESKSKYFLKNAQEKLQYDKKNWGYTYKKTNVVCLKDFYCTLNIGLIKAPLTRERLRLCTVCVFKKVFRSHAFVSFNVSVQTRPLETL